MKLKKGRKVKVKDMAKMAHSSLANYDNNTLFEIIEDKGEAFVIRAIGGDRNLTVSKAVISVI